MMDDAGEAIRAAREVLAAHGVAPERCEVLQNGSTVVVRLTETLVARVVKDVDGPRKGAAWFARENAIAEHLTHAGAPVIPLHDALPPGPHEHLGYPMNFWRYVTAVAAEPEPEEAGRTLCRCHEVLASFTGELPRLAILTEAVELLDTLAERELFPGETLAVLRRHLTASLDLLEGCPLQPLHGDAHAGNMMNTTQGLLWTDWEDAFAGPVEWDVASLIWNAKYLERDEVTVDRVLKGYTATGAVLDAGLMDACFTARAAVMTAWYPVLYPDLSEERKDKLQARLDWLASR